MQILGYYPPDQPSLLLVIRSFALYFSLIVLPVILAIINLYLLDEFDFVKSIYTFIFVENLSFCSLKLLPFLTNGHASKKCIIFFGQPQFAPRTPQEKKLVDKCVYFCRTCSKIFLYLIAGAATFWFTPTILEKKLPVEAWLPYDANSHWVIFCLTYLFLAIGNLYTAFAFAMIDPLMGTLSYHATTQLKILKYNLKNLYLFSNVQNKYGVIRLEHVHDVLRKCIRRHADILYFVTEFENCFSWSILCQIMTSVLCLCVCSFGITLSDSHSVDFYKCLTFYLFSWFQIFFYYSFGALLYEENNSFMEEVCAGPWYRYDIRIRKILFVMMERSKKPLIIRAGKVINLTFESYISILKTSYSLVAVLRNLVQ